MADGINIQAIDAVEGSVTAIQLPNVPCQYARIKALSDNDGNVSLGLSDSVLTWELAPGDETPWLPITNLRDLWMVCDNATDDIAYMTVG